MENDLHHYVPQFYLERFVGSRGKLWVYDKDNDRVFETIPRNVAGEHGFYKLPVVFQDRSLMERQFSAMEGEAASITKDWLIHIEQGNAIEIPKVNRAIISLFIATLLIRTAEAKHILMESLSSKLQVPIDDDVKRELHIDLLWNDEVVTKVSDWVHDCTWTFRNNSLPESLYTSDDPVKVRTRSKHLHWAQTTMVGAYLLIPLTPRIMMYCFDSQGWHQLKPLDCVLVPDPMEEELVKDANIHQVGHARRFVFAAEQDFETAKLFCAENPGAIGEERERFEVR